MRVEGDVSSEVCCEEGCHVRASRTSLGVDGEPRCSWHSSVRRRRIRVNIGQSLKGGYVEAVIHPVHARSCPYWRQGTRHGPCDCGAHEVWDEFVRQAKDGSRVTPSSVWELVRSLATWELDE